MLINKINTFYGYINIYVTHVNDGVLRYNIGLCNEEDVYYTLSLKREDIGELSQKLNEIVLYRTRNTKSKEKKKDELKEILSNVWNKTADKLMSTFVHTYDIVCAYNKKEIIRMYSDKNLLEEYKAMLKGLK